jgi:3-hydroxyisobutyrate dehydrogenase-like beta-hydroxyacid dehydrogenase
MQITTIGVIGAGDMGSGVAAALRRAGLDVVTDLSRRSGHSRQLAEAAGMRDLGSIDAVVDAADLILSILPPAAAVAFAESTLRAMRKRGRSIPFADCNAVAPEKLKRMATPYRDANIAFVDVGIVGRPPKAGGTGATRFYVSGPSRRLVTDLAVAGLRMIDMGDQLGRASAIKMAYASLNKGIDALLTTVLLAADAMGVRAKLIDELGGSQKEVLARIENRVPYLAATAERFAPEMHEIAATFEHAGVTPAFHQGAAWLYAMLAESTLASETRATLPAHRTLDDALAAFAAALDARARQ